MPAHPETALCRPNPGGRPVPVRTGPVLEVTIDELLCAGPSGTRSIDAIALLLGGGDEVAVRLAAGSSEPAAAGRFVAACGRLGRRLAAAGADTSRLSLTVAAAAVSPMLAWRARRSLLGAGRVDFVVGGEDFEPEKRDRARVRRRWFELWRLRNTSARIALWPEVRSACPLLATEPADALLPPAGLQAPRDSAWLAYPLDIARLPAVHGWPHPDAIERSVRLVLDDAAARIDSVRWPSARQAEDAWMNRRIGIAVSGIGNVVERCGLDPAASATFVELDGLLSTIRRAAFDRARGDVAGQQQLPAVVAANPCARLPPGTLRDAWETRWQRLVDEAALVHRNLVVMSPWSLFPVERPVVGYAGLLPLLRHADACVCGGRPRLDAWRLDEFVEMHRRAWALCVQAGGQAVVAEQL